MASARVKSFFTYFINLFFLGNFVVGSMGYIFIPEKSSPVPEPGTMFLIGIITALLAFLSLYHER